MIRSRRPIAFALLTLAAAACINDSPVGPRRAAVALDVQFQSAPAGDAIHVAVVSFAQNRDAPPDTLYQMTVQAAAGEQTITIPIDLTRCLPNFQPDPTGPYCVVGLDLQLLSQGAIVAEQFASGIVVRPGQVAQAAPVVLTAGNSAPAITATDTARWVDPALLRYRVTGTDPDGDIVMLSATDIWNGQLDLTTNVPFYPPLRTIDGWYYALETDHAGATAVQVYLSDSKYAISAIDTIAFGFPIGQTDPPTDVNVDSTKDSVVTQFHVFNADSVEIVVVNAALDSVYYVCGGSVPNDTTLHRVACGRPVPFTQALAVVVPFDPAGSPGNATRCSIPATGCQPLPGARRVRGARIRAQ